MNRYLKFVNFELSRFFKIYLVLIGITILFQIIAVITESKTYLNRANDLIYKELMPKAQFIEQYGTFSFFEVTNSTVVSWTDCSVHRCLNHLCIFYLVSGLVRKKYIYLSFVNVAYSSNECLFSKSDNDLTICFGSCSPAIIIISSRRSSDTNGWFQLSFVQICLFMKLQN